MEYIQVRDNVAAQSPGEEELTRQMLYVLYRWPDAAVEFVDATVNRDKAKPVENDNVTAVPTKMASI